MKRQLMKLSFKRTHPEYAWRDDYSHVFVDISNRFLQEAIKETGESLVTEDLPNVEYLGSSPALDFEYLRPLLATLPEPFVDPIIKEYHQEITYSFDDEEEELTMEHMILLIDFCKKHDLTFEMDSDYNATDRCGFLAYDSVVTPYIKITLTPKKESDL